MSRRLATALACAIALVGVTSCGYDATPLPSAASSTGTSGTTSGGSAPSATSTTQPCTDGPASTRSYAPDGLLPTPGQMPNGSTMAKIQKRGFLIAGIAADSYLLGARNPFTGKIEGFDIDMVDAIAQAIFGDDYEQHLQLRVITPADRIPLLMSGEIDIVSRNMTINCTRWQQIAFSEEYYHSGQKILVTRGSGITSIKGLAGKRACAPTGTTSLDNITKIAPDAIPVTATNDSGCLVKFQNGEADAITTDDTVLAGLAAQDPYAVVPNIAALTDEPYGIGVNSEQVDLVKFINGVLEDMRSDGRWQQSYQRWLAPSLGDQNTQPIPRYGRPEPG